MSITLHDLAGAEADRRFRPFCWRTRMVLAHKGLEVETVPWRFTEKDKLPKPNRGRVPVIVDDDLVVHDSTAIADHLEDRYPDRPALFGGEMGALARFVQNWTETVLLPGLIRLVLLDIHRRCTPEDQDYFWRSREERFVIRSGSGAATCSTCSTASLVPPPPPPTAIERALPNTFARPLASRDHGTTKTRDTAPRHATCSRPSMSGSPQAVPRPSSKR
jgi:Glutathione S-transferase, N-terminal domain